MGWLAAALVAACGVLAWLWQVARRDAEAQRRRADEAAATVDLAEADVARLEDVIDGKQREFRALLNEMANCRDPRAALALGERMLRDPWAGDHPAVPDGPAARVGAGGE